MRKKLHGLLAVWLTFSILLGMFPMFAFAEDAPAGEATVYLTVSNQGVFAADNDGRAMANRAVTVTDINGDGSFSYDEALIAAHKTYNTEDGYSAPGGMVGKLWGIETANTLFFINDQGLAAGVGVDTVADGDRMVASVNKDNTYYADWYAFFDNTEKTAAAGEEFSLTLKGHLGMAWTEEDKADTALANIQIGIWEDGAFSPLAGKTTDTDGRVNLSIGEAGTYAVSAEGTAEDQVTDYNLMNMSTADHPVYGVMDYETFATQMAYTEEDYGDGPYPADEVKYVDFEEWVENQDSYHTLRSNQLIASCPIIAPVCVVTVTDDEPEASDEPQVSDADTKLQSLSVTAPAEGASDFVTGLAFDPDVYEYDIEVRGVRTLKFAGEPMTEGADVKITSYYESLADANAGTLTTGEKAITTACYLPDAADTESTIVISVTAPQNSTQQEKTRTYTIRVKKSAASGPMTAFSVTASSTAGGAKDNWAGKDGTVPLEETLTPDFVDGSLSLGTYHVNYWRDQITVKPTAAGCTITAAGESVASGKDSSAIALQVGENKIPVQVTDENQTVTDYVLTVYRKSQLDITAIEVENGALNTPPGENGSSRTASGSFGSDTETLRLKFGTNVENSEEVDIRVAWGDQSYTGKAGEWIGVPVGDADTAMLYVWLCRTVNGVREGQVYIVNMSRVSADSPDRVTSYLPAPGQFVNEPIYADPNATLEGKQPVTLGAFGGNIVYQYDLPIENNPMNPYGIDFIIEGNAFTNPDGTSAQSASEPAAVMVSADGEVWYELAGSEYYDANTVHGITVTYTNPDTAFAGALDVPWADDQGGSGAILKNDAHPHPYYPNPAVYGAYQDGIGKNETYTDEQVSFTGTKVSGTVSPSFGYADNHAAGNYEGSPAANPKGSTAANPYIENHYAVYNGDGFDLDWAVDANGNPVELDSISYIKIYNPWLYGGGAIGEKSPEILQVRRAAAGTAEAGVSDGLTALSINGKAVALEEGKRSYEADAQNADSLTVTPTAVNGEANIYVSNQRVASGTSTKAFTAVEKLRIIVQEGNKEPAIYMISLTNIKTGESNADIASLTLTPGDDVKSPDEDGAFAFSVSNAVKSVRLTPEMRCLQAAAVLTGDDMEEIPLQHKTASPAIPLETGENHFTLTVTSADGSETKSYPVTVDRAGGGSSSGQDTLRVTFSLKGDTLHYDKETGKNTGKHTSPVWIKSQTVTVPAGSTVKYLTEMMLNNAELDYRSDGIYISEIDGLAEFDNGPNAGWMYRQNGKVASEGYNTRILSAGDKIEWFYTDDYTKEKDYESWKPGGGISSNPGNKGPAAVSTAEPEDEENTKTFADVPETHWAEAYIRDLAGKKILNGKSETEFAPEDNITRAEFAAILSRMSGDALPAPDGKFADVAQDAWYAGNVTWAVQAGITNGVSETEFAPEASITRQDMAVMIERYAGYKAYAFGVKNEAVTFADEDAIEGYAKEAVSTMQKAGIIAGMGDNTFAPLAFATRAQAAKMLSILLSDMSN